MPERIQKVPQPIMKLDFDAELSAVIDGAPEAIRYSAADKNFHDRNDPDRVNFVPSPDRVDGAAFIATLPQRTEVNLVREEAAPVTVEVRGPRHRKETTLATSVLKLLRKS